MRIVLVDDHPEVVNSLAEFMQGLGHEIDIARDGAEALQRIRRHKPDFVLSDVRMPGMDGLKLLAALEDTEPPIKIALMTAFSDTSVAVEALRHGAVDYLRKPIDVVELHALLERHAPPSPSTDNYHAPSPQADGLLICGPAFGAVVALADRLHKARNLPCVIEAETGCGKELIARRIHHGGTRTDTRPWVPLNCAAISPNLFESELFGYAPGAFSGARDNGATGKFSAAGNGTIFLDEIGELSLDQQAKLLRVLEDRTWYPVGSNHLERLEARVICASNRPLADLVAKGTFREDLLYRLKVGYLRIPPLRERPAEIAFLANGLLPSIRQRLGGGFKEITPAAVTLFTHHSWPGTVRELAHVLEIGAVTLDGAVLHEGHARTLLGKPPVAPDSSTAADSNTNKLFTLPSTPPAEVSLEGPHFALDDWHRAIIIAALAKHDGSPVTTSAYLGISRKVLYSLRKRYGLLTQDLVDAE